MQIETPASPRRTILTPGQDSSLLQTSGTELLDLAGITINTPGQLLELANAGKSQMNQEFEEFESPEFNQTFLTIDGELVLKYMMGQM